MRTKAWHAGIDGRLREAAEARQVPGVVAVAANASGVIYEAAFGRLSLPEGAPMGVGTVVWIASMIKAITAVAAMQLAEQGKLSLELTQILPFADPVELRLFEPVEDLRHAQARRRIRLHTDEPQSQPRLCEKPLGQRRGRRPQIRPHAEPQRLAFSTRNLRRRDR